MAKVFIKFSLSPGVAGGKKMSPMISSLKKRTKFREETTKGTERDAYEKQPN